MMECKLLKDEGRVIISENGDDVFKANLIIKSNIALLDEINFSKKKTEELSSGKVLQTTVSFLNKIETEVMKTMDEKGLNIDLVTFGSFALVKELDKVAEDFDMSNFKEVKLSSKR